MLTKCPAATRAAPIVRFALGAVILLGSTASTLALGDAIGPVRRDSEGRVVPVVKPSALPRGHSANRIENSLELATPQGSVEATQIAVEYHDGQSFVTWKDAAEGDQAVRYRYSLYRSDRRITEKSLASAKLVEADIMYNSAKLYGSDFSPKDRLDPSKPTTRTHDGGAPLPQWSGLAVYTTKKSGTAYYAVVVTDPNFRRLGKIVPGMNATTTGINEQVVPLRPIEISTATQRAQVPASTALLREAGLPLMLSLHGSDSSGGHVRTYGDFYIYFGDDSMGWRDGMPGAFTVGPALWTPGRMLDLAPRDAILKPDGSGAIETNWFGYYATPQWAPDSAPRAYPFTENRLLWLIGWTAKRYHIDPNRIYANGQSMGGWGCATFAFRHPEIFAAVFPQMPRFRQRLLATVVALPPGATVLMPNGSDYFDRMDMVRFARAYRGELPFLGWSIGRHDGFATWKEQVDMVHALEETHRGFVFAWNDGNHGDGVRPMLNTIWKDYPPEKFRRDQSYPAFSNSSIDDNPGNGDPEDGDPEGGINLGFRWSTPVDTQASWSTAVSNRLAKAMMTADVTPRRAQKFKLSAGIQVAWRASSGQSGTAVADAAGLITIPKLEILPSKETTVTILR